MKDMKLWSFADQRSSFSSMHSVCLGRRKFLAKKKQKMATSKLRSRKSSSTFATLNQSLCLRQLSSTHSVVSGVLASLLLIIPVVAYRHFAVVFFRTQPPIEPVSFVRTICEDVRKGSYTLHFHSVKRLTPMTLIGKATENGLLDIARRVLAPHFHQGGSSEKKVRKLSTTTLSEINRSFRD